MPADPNKPAETKLSERMRALAETHERGDELRASADAFDRATAGYYAKDQTLTAPAFLGVYARARKLWCEITGEELV